MPKRQQLDQPLTEANVDSNLAVTVLTLSRWTGEGRFPTPPRNPDGSYAIDSTPRASASPMSSPPRQAPTSQASPAL